MRDPEKRKAEMRSYYERNREARKTYAREYYATKREAIIAKRNTRRAETKASTEDTARAQRLADIRARNGAKMRAAMGIA